MLQECDITKRHHWGGIGAVFMALFSNPDITHLKEEEDSSCDFG